MVISRADWRLLRVLEMAHHRLFGRTIAMDPRHDNLNDLHCPEARWDIQGYLELIRYVYDGRERKYVHLRAF